MASSAYMQKARSADIPIASPALAAAAASPVASCAAYRGRGGVACQSWCGWRTSGWPGSRSRGLSRAALSTVWNAATMSSTPDAASTPHTAGVGRPAAAGGTRRSRSPGRPPAPSPSMHAPALSQSDNPARSTTSGGSRSASAAESNTTCAVRAVGGRGAGGAPRPGRVDRPGHADRDRGQRHHRPWCPAPARTGQAPQDRRRRSSPRPPSRCHPAPSIGHQSWQRSVVRTEADIDSLQGGSTRTRTTTTRQRPTERRQVKRRHQDRWPVRAALIQRRHPYVATPRPHAKRRKRGSASLGGDDAARTLGGIDATRDAHDVAAPRTRGPRIRISSSDCPQSIGGTYTMPHNRGGRTPLRQGAGRDHPPRDHQRRRAAGPPRPHHPPAPTRTLALATRLGEPVHRGPRPTRLTIHIGQSPAVDHRPHPPKIPANPTRAGRHPRSADQPHPPHPRSRAEFRTQGKAACRIRSVDRGSESQITFSDFGATFDDLKAPPEAEVVDFEKLKRN